MMLAKINKVRHILVIFDMLLMLWEFLRPRFREVFMFHVHMNWPAAH